MRTIELTEHRAGTYSLTQDELSQVLSTGLVEAAPVRGAHGQYRLRPGSIVGTVVLDGVRLLIRPKVSVENLFYMMGFGVDLVEWAGRHFPFETHPDLLAVIGWLLEAEVRRALAGGVVRGYEVHHEALATVRGRIDVSAQLRARQGLPLPLECQFDELTADILLNRVVKAAIHTLLRTAGLDSALSRALRYRLHSFAEVATVEYREADVPDVPLSRLSGRWEHAVGLARLILSRQVLRDREGAVLGSAFTVDMNRLFERYVTEVVRGAVPAGMVVDAQARRHLAPRVPIRPDIVLRQHGHDVAVADIKYKLPATPWHNPDAYQLLAYCTALGLRTGLLIYASPLPHESQPVFRAGVQLQRRGIDLGADRHSLRAQVEELALSLVASASLS